MKTRCHLLGRRQRGAALLLTLWCIAIVAATVVLTARMVDSDVEGESTRSRRFEARELALTSIAHGSNPSLKRNSALLHQRPETGGELLVRVTSENARLNINLLLRQPGRLTLKQLFQIWGMPEEEARIAIDSLIDWTDGDELRQLNGAERENLLDQRQYSRPENRDFQSVAEMRRVRGMDAVARHQPDWKEFFSVFSGEQVDIQDVSPDILRALGGFSLDQTSTLLTLRNGPDDLPGTPDDHKIETLDEIIQYLGLSEAQTESLRTNFQVGAEPIRIESTATLGGTRYYIATVVNRSRKKPVSLSWEER